MVDIREYSRPNQGRKRKAMLRKDDRMSDPGTTYRTRDEIQQMRSEKDTIQGLKKYLLEWGVTDEDTLKVCLSLPSSLLILDARLTVGPGH